jgi:MFS family permease
MPRMTTSTSPQGVNAAGLGAAFWRMWTAAVVSRFGDALRGPALSLLAAGLTRDPRAIALVVAAGQVPTLLFGLVGGALADRWDRRRSMACADALRFLLVLCLAVAVAAGRAGVALLVVFAFVLSTVATLFDASAFAILPDLVSADRLVPANGRLAAGTTVAGGLLGAPAAGVLFAVAAALPFGIDAATFAVAAGLALTLPARPRSGRPPRRALWAEVVGGVRWVNRQPVLRLLAVLTAGCNLVISALVAVLVLLVLDVFKVPVIGYGLVAVVISAGSIVGGLAAGRIGTRLGSLAALRWVLVVQAAALGILAVAHQVVPGSAALAVFGAGGAVWNVLANSYQQRAVPDALRGRVSSANRVIGLAAAPVGATLGGVVAARFGVPAVAAGGAVLLVLLAALSWRPLAGGSRPV